MTATVTAPSGRKVHPLYTQVPAEKRYGGKLADLLPLLRRELTELAGRLTQAPATDDPWPVWRCLPTGAVVALRVRESEEMRREIRIARGETLTNDAQRAKWDAEVATFARHFGITLLDGETPAPDFANYYVRQDPHPRDAGKTAVRLIELRKGETVPGKGLCHPCLKQGRRVAVTWFPPAGLHQLCTVHIAETSRAYVQGVLQRTRRAPSAPGGRVC